MCTVVFIPAKDKLYFASLRDESPKRARAIAPEVYVAENRRYLSPKDPLAGGTWAGINDYRNVVILLNGAFENHMREENYLKSRGLIVTELLTSLLPVVDWNLMELEHIEPFTLIIWSEGNLFELVWDGIKKHRKLLDSTLPHLWSSSTLYDLKAKTNRTELFQNWIAMNPPVSKLTLLNFFQSINDPKNGFIIDRNERMKTLSYSFLELQDANVASMDYFDLLNFKHTFKTLELSGSSNMCLIPSYKDN